MAARRLVVVMLVLLAISTLAAALLPQPENREPVPPEARQKEDRRPATEMPETETGLLLVARMAISDRRPKAVRIERGDRLRLGVTAPFGADIEIPGLGRAGVVTPSAPARFDLLPTQIGTFPVRIVGSGEVAGTLLVGRPGSGRCGVSTPSIPQGRVSASSCALRDERGSRGSGRSARRP